MPVAASRSRSQAHGPRQLRNSLPGHLDAARLAVLADMLEEPGCTDPQLLGHLRGPGAHVRGCHVLDAVLGMS
jgi:hypothetical protein